ncbi:MAG: ABC transporter ATP-binding protein [Trueperaceae bacterium]
MILEVKNLSVDYKQKNKTATALHDVSFALERGEILGVVGESGCGKTTLMLALLRLLPQAGQITRGQILYDGKDILPLDNRAMAELRWDEISIVFQGAMNALNPVCTIAEQIAEAIRRHEKLSKEAARKRVEELLELVGIPKHRRSDYPHHYSGGMRQRAMIAMALACHPKIIIADEPTTALDVMVQAQILELLADLRDKLGLAVIFVTHDLGVVAELCDSVLVLYGGVTAEYADVDTLFNAPQHPYTERLLAAFPNLENPKALESIPGSPPRLDDLPKGCRFAPRCSKVMEQCHSEMPRLYQVNPWQYSRCFLSEVGKI